MLNICIICNDNVTNLHDDIDYVTESESDEDWLVTIHQEAALGWSVLQEHGSLAALIESETAADITIMMMTMKRKLPSTFI